MDIPDEVILTGFKPKESKESKRDRKASLPPISADPSAAKPAPKLRRASTKSSLGSSDSWRRIPIKKRSKISSNEELFQDSSNRGVRSVGPVRRAGRFCSGLRGRRIEDIPYHFKKGMVCQF
jgi:hypothetical protein